MTIRDPMATASSPSTGDTATTVGRPDEQTTAPSGYDRNATGRNTDTAGGAPSVGVGDAKAVGVSAGVGVARPVGVPVSAVPRVGIGVSVTAGVADGVGVSGTSGVRST